MFDQPIIKLATRGSPLALAQAHLAQAHLAKIFPEKELEILIVETRADHNLQWSLEREGGTGLFTAEVERAVREGDADIAVHSAKDLPSRDGEGVTVAGYLPRANPADVLVLRDGTQSPTLIASSSPRRRAQAKRMFPTAVWNEIRGNVNTRLNKIAQGGAEATFLAAAGLERLGISEHPGVRFQLMPITDMVPAGGQGAIALQTRAKEAESLRRELCLETAHAVEIERRFLARLGVGCHTAFAVHWSEGQLYFYHENFETPQSVAFSETDPLDMDTKIDALIQEYML